MTRTRSTPRPRATCARSAPTRSRPPSAPSWWASSARAPTASWAAQSAAAPPTRATGRPTPSGATPTRPPTATPTALTASSGTGTILPAKKAGNLEVYKLTYDQAMSEISTVLNDPAAGQSGLYSHIAYIDDNAHRTGSNCLFVDGHVAKYTLDKTMDPRNWMWGDKIYSCVEKPVLQDPTGSGQLGAPWRFLSRWSEDRGPAPQGPGLTRLGDPPRGPQPRRHVVTQCAALRGASCVLVVSAVAFLRDLPVPPRPPRWKGPPSHFTSSNSPMALPSVSTASA